MDIIDEKANGGPPMEIVEDVVSVRDRPFTSPAISPHFLTLPPDEAFAAKHMPDLGHDVKDFKVYTWRLTNWKKLEKKITSPEFDCGGHRWSVLLSPPLATQFRPLL
jgi:ubiquitin carboxyl-terminal hydrolase 7